MSPFSYPASAHVRKHGPAGYAHYENYRPWLRDEFCFRCVYCQAREAWWTLGGTYAIDHFTPVALQPNLATKYANLLYACSGCNLAKADRVVPDPTRVLLGAHVRILEDGSIEADSKEARRLIDKLGLDRPKLRGFRELWISIIRVAAKHDAVLFVKLMGFPEDLPDLSKLRPPKGNARPEGVEQSYYARRERSELASTF